MNIHSLKDNQWTKNEDGENGNMMKWQKVRQLMVQMVLKSREMVELHLMTNVLKAMAYDLLRLVMLSCNLACNVVLCHILIP